MTTAQGNVVTPGLDAIPPGLEGLSSGEAAVLLAKVGPNRWVPPDPFAWLREAFLLLLDPMAIMLAIAATIYFALGDTRDAAVLLLALIPVLGVDVLLEARSRAALAKLARAASPLAEIVRDARVRAIPLEEVVPGDLLVMQEGHTIAADGVTLWAANLAIDESSLTGESEPQVKQATLDIRDAAPDSRFFAGSLVVAGHGFGRVTKTGSGTQYGGIAALVAGTTPALSPLQQRASQLARRLGGAAALVALALVPLSRLRGDSWTEALLGAVSLAMAAIPEEFPIVLTLFLSVGAWRLASRGMLVRRLASVETLGSTSVICTDKTGTLTRGDFQVTDHVVFNGTIQDDEFLEAAVLACEPHPADAMERAICGYAEQRGVSLAAIAARWTLVRDYAFDPIGKHMTHAWRAVSAHDAFLVAAKGAVEGVLAHIRPDPAARAQMLEANKRFAERGLRVLALAAKRTDRLGSNREDDERDLTVFGLIGFQDPIRPEVPTAVAECQRAGIRVKMITGDHALTAHAVAEATGILHEEGVIVTGDELNGLSDADRDRCVQRAAIFARISPQQKFWIVDALRRDGAIVAMTGDGVNDAPALRRANIGIAMGQRGTDVARATADLVLLNDNFASIVATVREGRHILQNVQRAFLYLIAFHVPIVFLAIITPLADVPLVLLPIHLVWLELIVHPVSAFVFQAEPPTASIMTRPPRDPAAPLLPRTAVVRSAATGATLAVTTFLVYWLQYPVLGEAAARAMALATLLAGYQTLVFVERAALPGTTISIPRTRVFWTVWCASTLSAAAVFSVPSLEQLCRIATPSGTGMAWAALAGVVAVVWRAFLRPSATAELTPSSRLRSREHSGG